MVNKKQSAYEKQIASRIKGSANQIWLAGLGAYSKVEEEGSKLFDGLVKDGKQLDDQTKGPLESKLPGISAYREKVEEVRDRATGSWERIEKAFDERVSNALGRLNIPTRTDVEELARRVDALESALKAAIQDKEKPE